MAGGERKNWRELANAALEAKDPDKLLQIVQELNKVLKTRRAGASRFQGCREGEQVLRRRRASRLGWLRCTGEGISL